MVYDDLVLVVDLPGQSRMICQLGWLKDYPHSPRSRCHAHRQMCCLDRLVRDSYPAGSSFIDFVLASYTRLPFCLSPEALLLWPRRVDRCPLAK